MTLIPTPEPKPIIPEAIALREGRPVFCPDGRVGELISLRVFSQCTVRLANKDVVFYNWKDLTPTGRKKGKTMKDALVSWEKELWG